MGGTGKMFIPRGTLYPNWGPGDVGDLTTPAADEMAVMNNTNIQAPIATGESKNIWITLGVVLLIMFMLHV